MSKKNTEFNFEDHFKPCTNGVILQKVVTYRAGDEISKGIILAPAAASSTPEADDPTDPTGDNLGLRVITVGPDVTRVKAGDLIVMLPNSNFVEMTLFGDKYLFTPDYNIMATLSEEADRINKSMKKDMSKKDEQLRAANLARMLGVDNKPDNLDLN